jgi:CPA2 family monovalent cation:H+ antiporter-2
MVMGESELSQQATDDAMPLRDAFAVLFFVSVGMLLNPAVFVEAPLAVLGTVAIVMIGKSAAAWLIVRAFRHPNATALTISASLAQIGEFSFILIGLGISLSMVPAEARDLVLAGSIISIVLNPLVFAALDRLRPKEGSDGVEPASLPAPTGLSGHTVLIGYGRVGSLIGGGLAGTGTPFVVIETGERAIAQARQDGAEVIVGNAAGADTLAAANLAAAKRLVVTIPEAFEAVQVVEQARAANRAIEILARAHSDAAVEHLGGLGADLVISGEREIAERMLERIRGVRAE